MKAYVEGNQTSFAVLVHRYERELFGYLRRLTGNDSTAEEVFQNTFLQVHLKRHFYDGERSFRPWLYTVATNQAIDLLRRHQRHQHASLDEESGDGVGPTRSGSIADGAAGPSASAEQHERARLVRAAVDRLSEHLKVVVLLSYYQGMKYKEIARVLRIPVGTVKSRLHTAIRRLGSEWKRLGVGDDSL